MLVHPSIWPIELLGTEEGRKISQYLKRRCRLKNQIQIQNMRTLGRKTLQINSMQKAIWWETRKTKLSKAGKKTSLLLSTRCSSRSSLRSSKKMRKTLRRSWWNSIKRGKKILALLSRSKNCLRKFTENKNHQLKNKRSHPDQIISSSLKLTSIHK